MAFGPQIAERSRFRGIANRAGKVTLLIFGQCIGVLFPLTFYPLGVWGGHTFHFYLVCAVVQSAAIFYGMDLFDQSRSPYLWSLVTYFITATVVGAIVFAAGTKEIWFHDGSCLPFGGPTYLFFALFAFEFLPFALIISPLWMAIRWIENMVQDMWFRKNHKKMLEVLSS